MPREKSRKSPILIGENRKMENLLQLTKLYTEKQGKYCQYLSLPSIEIKEAILSKKSKCRRLRTVEELVAAYGPDARVLYPTPKSPGKQPVELKVIVLRDNTPEIESDVANDPASRQLVGCAS